MKDKETGISIQFISEFKPDEDLVTDFDRALIIASRDTRAVHHLVKVLDALVFLKEKEHQL